MLTAKDAPVLDVLDAHERESLRALLEAQTEPERLQAAYQLRRVVARAARETSGETFGRFEDELYGALFRAVHHGSTLDERLGGVAALEALIGAPSAEPEGKGSKFADVLSSALRRCCEGDRPSGCLRASDAQREFVTRCAAALGRLARRGPASSSAHVEVEVSRALEWLEDEPQRRNRFSRKRLAACLVLRELARHAPTLFYARVRDFFEKIWPAVVDVSHPDVRDAAASALAAALELVAARTATSYSGYYCAIYQKAHRALEKYVDAGKKARRRSLPAALKLADLLASEDEALAFFSSPTPASPGREEGPLSSLKRLFSPSKEDEPSTPLQRRASLTPRLTPPAKYLTHAQREAAAHGALLAIGALLDHAGAFMTPRFREACDAALALRDHASVRVRRAVTDLLPRLAHYQPDAFSRTYLGGATAHLLETAKKPGKSRDDDALRDAAYTAIGKLALAVKHRLRPALPELVAVVRDHCLDAPLTREERPLHGVHSAWAFPFRRPAVVQPKRAGSTTNADASLAPELRSIALGATGHSTKNVVVTRTMDARRAVVVACVADVFEALGEDVPSREADQLLDALFRSGLSEPLIRALDVIARAVPSRRSAVRARLLETLVAGLEPDKRFAPPGWRRPAPQHGEGSAFLRAVSGVDETVVLLSLTTLASFELDGRACLLPLARDTVAPYLQAPAPLVRAAAARACARLLLPRGDYKEQVESSSESEDDGAASPRRGLNTPPRTPQRRSASPRRLQAAEDEEERDGLLQPHYYCGPSAVVVDDVLSKLLAVALADDDLAPRRAVVRALRTDSRFDGHLARAKHVDALALLLHDEDCDLQLDALALLGRLAARNPGAALAVVRNALARALDALRCAGPDPVARERAARLAAGALRAESPRARKAVWPLAAAVVAALPLGYRPLDSVVETESRVPTRLACAALDALGECVLVLGSRARDVVYVPRVLAPLFDALLDRSSTRKRELALRVLGRLASCAGCVVAPYLEHAPLLPRVLAVVCENSAARRDTDDKPLATQHSTWSLCREALRTLGLLGALDPYAFDVVQRAGRDDRLKARKRALINDELLAPHLAALLDEDPGEPCSSAMYAQSCAVALPAVPDAKDVVTEVQNEEDAYYASTTLAKANVSTDDAFLHEAKKHRRRRDGSSRKLKDDAKPTPQQGQEYYARCAVDALVRVLRDPSLASHHATTTQALTQVVRALGHRCVPFLGALVPHLLDVAKDGEPGLRESVLQQLASLASTARFHLRDYVPRILNLVVDYWACHLEQVVPLLEQVAAANNQGPMRPFATRALPLLLASLAPPTAEMEESGVQPASRDEARLALVLRATMLLRESLADALFLVAPALLKLADALGGAGYVSFVDHDCVPARGAAWQARVVRCLRVSCSGSALARRRDVGARITRDVCRLLERSGCCEAQMGATEHLRDACYSTLRSCRAQLGAEAFRPFAPLADKALRVGPNGHQSRSYKRWSRRIVDGDWSNGSDSDDDAASTNPWTPTATERELADRRSRAPSLDVPISPTNDFRANPANLQRAWDVSQRVTANDWNDWLRRLSLELLKESPSPALRACAAVAHAYPRLAHHLFQPAFVSCWGELDDQYRDSLVRTLETAFRSDALQAAAPDALQALLELAEFMERDVDALPIDIRQLADLATRCRAYAKALHYKELEFATPELARDRHAAAEQLIAINRKLGQPEAALGVLHATRRRTARRRRTRHINPRPPEPQNDDECLDKTMRFHDDVNESWLGKLGSYDEALQRYRRRLDNDPADGEAVLGAVKCLDALGAWREACDLLVLHWQPLKAAAKEHTLERRSSIAALDELAAQAGMRGEGQSRRPSYPTPPPTPLPPSTRTPVPRLLMKAANVGARAAWALGRWAAMGDFVRAMDDSDAGKPFYRAVLALRPVGNDVCEVRRSPSDALRLVDDCRKLLHPAFAALVGESYKRAYGTTVTVQQLAELEEIAEVRQLERDAQSEIRRGGDAARAQSTMRTKRRDLAATWRRRLAGCADDVATWQRVLNVRALVFDYRDDPDGWLRYASLCRNAGNAALTESVLTRQLGFDVASDALVTETFDQRRLRYAYAKHCWRAGREADALLRAEGLSQALAGLDDDDSRKLRARCLLRVGDWKLASQECTMRQQKEAADAFRAAASLDGSSYKAWHAWALANYRAVQRATRRRTDIAALARPEVRAQLVAAARGFVKALSLGTRRRAASAQQDLLNLLNLWFRFGRQPDVEAQLVPRDEGGMPLDAWLGVLPQLIARVGAGDASPKSALYQVLARLGARHPQALVYPLALQLKSPRADRAAAARAIIDAGPRRVAARLVEQALLVSEELVRVAILWHEKWHEGLEEASRLYFGDGDVASMLAILKPLHAELDAGPTTLREASFKQAFGRDLKEAHKCLGDYEACVRAEQALGLDDAPRRKASDVAEDAVAAAVAADAKHAASERGEDEGPQSPEEQRLKLRDDADAALNQAWDLYYTVFRRVNKQLPQLTTLELRYVSPALLNARSLELAVPGTYRVDGSAARIARFSPSVHVITSKQRPRRLAMRGEDGREYGFLLKGHEDLRQDERAMQLFGLANALLSKDRRTSEHGHLLIQRYAITPLSQNCGIIGWVPACDTLHALVRDFRDARKVVLNVEHRVMLQLAPDYDALALPQKVEVFHAALANTAGHDLSKVLWLKSCHSEQWLERRTHYARSLAVMSMVGHILGLGDRHPSNLMLDRRTGKVLHIDFGDCFEVAMHRDKFPERVPFRLTRMLVHAMEVSGVEGTYRLTCERVMRVLRDNRDSLLSMLEAFIHDPLISWRLLGAAEPELSRRSTLSAPVVQSSDEEEEAYDSYDSDETEEDDETPDSSLPSSRKSPLLSNSRKARSQRKGARTAGSHRREQMHHRMTRMANSLTSTRYSGAVGRASKPDSVAASRLDHRSARESLRVRALGAADGAELPNGALNERALAVMARVQAKLGGEDFGVGRLPVAEQVDRLILQSTDVQNLCQSFVGWCPFW